MSEAVMRELLFRATLNWLCSILLLVAAAAAAAGQVVTFADVEGITLEADIRRTQVVRRDRRTISLNVEQNWKVVIGDDKTISFTLHVRSQGPRRTRKDQRGGMFILDKPRDVASRGGGEAVWTFADGTLTFVRTFRSGARRLSIAFERGADGLTCSASFAFARQDGSGPIRLEGLSGREQVIVRAKQISSTCSITSQD
jgi:hypothetical protein